MSLRIAVADDEPLIRRFYAEVLGELGHTVVVAAENGEELVRECAALPQPPDLILTDIRMPVLDGIDAALQITQLRPIPVILVSAYHDEDLLARAEACHAMAYLVKPVERAHLEATIRMARSRFEQIESLQREAADLRQALEDRKLIERAKGLLMQTTGLSEPAALKRMQRMASDTNRKLIAVAKLILDASPALEMLKKTEDL